MIDKQVTIHDVAGLHDLWARATMLAAPRDSPATADARLARHAAASGWNRPCATWATFAAGVRCLCRVDCRDRRYARPGD